MWKITDYFPHQVFSCCIVVSTVYVLVIVISSKHMSVYIYIFSFENEMIPFSLYQNFFKQNKNMFKSFQNM